MGEAISSSVASLAHLFATVAGPEGDRMRVKLKGDTLMYLCTCTL